ncbi:MAG: hypothetical protein R3324_01015 [Halobacteriales archaeon]|nr:hypothetical protein [Halobacteriales archaeon]
MNGVILALQLLQAGVIDAEEVKGDRDRFFRHARACQALLDELDTTSDRED